MAAEMPKPKGWVIREDVAEFGKSRRPATFYFYGFSPIGAEGWGGDHKFAKVYRTKRDALSVFPRRGHLAAEKL